MAHAQWDERWRGERSGIIRVRKRYEEEKNTALDTPSPTHPRPLSPTAPAAQPPPGCAACRSVQRTGSSCSVAACVLQVLPAAHPPPARESKKTWGDGGFSSNSFLPPREREEQRLRCRCSSRQIPGGRLADSSSEEVLRCEKKRGGKGSSFFTRDQRGRKKLQDHKPNSFAEGSKTRATEDPNEQNSSYTLALFRRKRTHWG